MTRFILLFVFLLGCAGPLSAQVNGGLEGVVVCCADCWAEADRNMVEYGTAENLLKAKSCVEGGDPTLLAVRELDNSHSTSLCRGAFACLARIGWSS